MKVRIKEQIKVTAETLEEFEKIKSFSDNILTILLTKTDDIEPELLKSVNAFLTEPISKNLLISTINSNLKTKNSLEKLSNSTFYK